MSNAKLMLLTAVVVTLAASVMYAETEKGISKNNKPGPVKRTTIAVDPAVNPFNHIDRAANPDAVSLPVGPFLIFQNANFRTAGVGLRNRGSGVIQLNGLPPLVPGGPITSAALLYWTVITDTFVAAPKYGVVNLRRLPDSTSGDPGTGFFTFTGVVAGVSLNPGWLPIPPPPAPTPGITTFVALVPTSLVDRNGAYQITIPSNARGLTDGSDPFSFPSPAVSPLWEGAALVAITHVGPNVGGSPLGTVVVYNPAFTIGNIGPEVVDFVLNLPTPAVGGTTEFAQFDQVWADGQKGSSLQGDEAGIANEITAVNGNSVAGYVACGLDRPSLRTDCSSDMNGSTASPGPLLWDVHSHDISHIVPAGQKAILVEVVEGFQGSMGPNDVISPVAMVVEYQ